MIAALQELTTADLKVLADALRSKRLAPPYTQVGVQRFCAGPDAVKVAQALQTTSEAGASPAVMAMMLELLVEDRGRRTASQDCVTLVWTGPESPKAPSRDTSVVVRELFQSATKSVLVGGYAIHQGKEVFATLAKRMEELPDLNVEMFLDIQRPFGETTIEVDLVARFRSTFRQREWPGKRLPDVYYYRRSLDLDPNQRSCLHAKCIVIDDERAFVSSANFTGAGQNRNIEAGVLIASPNFAAHLADQFRALASEGQLAKLHW